MEGGPTRTRAAPNPTSRDCLQFLSSIRKAKSREKGRREESEDEGNEMILGSWTFISLSDKNKAREGDKRGEERMGRLPLVVYFLPFSSSNKKGKRGEMRTVCK